MTDETFDDETLTVEEPEGSDELDAQVAEADVEPPAEIPTDVDTQAELAPEGDSNE